MLYTIIVRHDIMMLYIVNSRPAHNAVRLNTQHRMQSTEPITPPATLGVLGGGQLGMYFVIAARDLGYHTIVLEPDSDCPAGQHADAHIVAPYDDTEALERLARDCDVITTEFENPPALALTFLAERTLVRPSPHAIEIAQDRRLEKRFLNGNGFPTAPFAIVTDGALPDGAHVSFPAILKTARMGYDGKGQIQVKSLEQLPKAWEELGGVPCVLEQLLPLERELSVVLARAVDGTVSCFAVTENVHVDGILHVSTAPYVGSLANTATQIATDLANALNYVGVLGVEMFVVDDVVLVNEIAPRPHNSGHWTLDASIASQFEQQVRAVCGIELAQSKMTSPAVAMVNILGDMWTDGEPDWDTMTTQPYVHLHLYGKKEPRTGRKMGHLTVTAGTVDAARDEALRLTKHRE
jgi:5-(carboxyamino)imidazole ribonucleotide synthase